MKDIQDTFDQAVKKYMENEAKIKKPLPQTGQELEDMRDYWLDQALDEYLEEKEKEKK